MRKVSQLCRCFVDKRQKCYRRLLLLIDPHGDDVWNFAAISGFVEGNNSIVKCLSGPRNSDRAVLLFSVLGRRRDKAGVDEDGQFWIPVVVERFAVRRATDLVTESATAVVVTTGSRPADVDEVRVFEISLNLEVGDAARRENVVDRNWRSFSDVETCGLFSVKAVGDGESFKGFWRGDDFDVIVTRLRRKLGEVSRVNSVSGLQIGIPGAEISERNLNRFHWWTVDNGSNDNFVLTWMLDVHLSVDEHLGRVHLIDVGPSGDGRYDIAALSCDIELNDLFGSFVQLDGVAPISGGSLTFQREIGQAVFVFWKLISEKAERKSNIKNCGMSKNGWWIMQEKNIWLFVLILFFAIILFHSPLCKIPSTSLLLDLTCLLSPTSHPAIIGTKQQPTN